MFAAAQFIGPVFEAPPLRLALTLNGNFFCSPSEVGFGEEGRVYSCGSDLIHIATGEFGGYEVRSLSNEERKKFGFQSTITKPKGHPSPQSLTPSPAPTQLVTNSPQFTVVFSKEEHPFIVVGTGNEVPVFAKPIHQSEIVSKQTFAKGATIQYDHLVANILKTRTIVMPPGERLKLHIIENVNLFNLHNFFIARDPEIEFTTEDKEPIEVYAMSLSTQQLSQSPFSFTPMVVAVRGRKYVANYDTAQSLRYSRLSPPVGNDDAIKPDQEIWIEIQPSPDQMNRRWIEVDGISIVAKAFGDDGL